MGSMSRDTLEAIALLGGVALLSLATAKNDRRDDPKQMATVIPYAPERSVVIDNQNQLELYVRLQEGNSEPQMIRLADYLANIGTDKDRMNEFYKIRDALFPSDK
ncbi:MAG TPA: hypothetical protein VJC07_05490 [Candidatus Nanoarchaeia archaeon]|nr:hypothetical protein [Candidatus Nanoarchaeia archaeon]